MLTYVTWEQQYPLSPNVKIGPLSFKINYILISSNTNELILFLGGAHSLNLQIQTFILICFDVISKHLPLFSEFL